MRKMQKRSKLFEKRSESVVDFCKQFLAEMEEFKAHAHRVSAQYGAMPQLKEQLPANHATIQMDFVVNY